MDMKIETIEQVIEQAEKAHKDTEEMLRQLKKSEASSKKFEEELKNEVKCFRNKYYPRIPKPSAIAKPVPVKPSDYLLPNRKGSKKSRHPPMPPPPRIRPVYKDLTEIEVLDLTSKDKQILTDLTGGR